MKRFIYVFMFLLILAVQAHALPPVGGPHLWLSTDPATFDEGGVGYVGVSSDPWKTDSYVPEDLSFTIYLYNASPHYTATNVGLMVTIHDGETGFVKITDEFGNLQTVSIFPNTDISPYYGGGNHGVYAPHDGVFAVYQPAPYISVAKGDYTWFDIESFSFSQVHFDAFSEDGFYNPASHDVTDRTNVIPEPASMMLLGLGLFGLGFTKRKKT